MLNPFGEDDDDFSMNWIIDRNMQVSLLVVDDLHGAFPPTEKDIYFGQSPPDFLPYTKSSIDSVRQPYMGSTANLRFEVCLAIFVTCSVVGVIRTEYIHGFHYFQRERQ